MFSLRSVEDTILLKDHVGKLFQEKYAHIEFLFENYPSAMEHFTNASLMNLLIVFGNREINNNDLKESLKTSLMVSDSILNKDINLLLKEYNFLYHHGVNFQDQWQEDWLDLFPKKRSFLKKFNQIIIEENNLHLLHKIYLVHSILNNYDYLLKSFELTGPSSIENINISYHMRDGNQVKDFFNTLSYSLEKKYRLIKEAIECNWMELLDCARMFKILKNNKINLPHFKIKDLKSLHDKITLFFIQQQVLLNNEKLNSDYTFLNNNQINSPIELYGAYQSILNRNITTPSELINSLWNISNVSTNTLKNKYNLKDFSTNNHLFQYFLFDYIESIPLDIRERLYNDFKISKPQRGGDLVLIGHQLKICVGAYVPRVINNQSTIVSLQLKENSLILNNTHTESLICAEYQTPMEVTACIEIDGKKQIIKRQPLKNQKILTQIKAFKNQNVHHSIENYFKSLTKF